MEVLLICKYCNNKWTRNLYTGAVVDEKCIQCGDMNLDVKELAKTKIDGYVGCPAFPEKKEEEKESPNFPYWHNGD